MGLNVLMLMFDSTSAAQFQRKMRRSLDYLSNEVESIFFKGEGIVGDGTTAQLSAMLTGIAEENQAEARRGKLGATTVDDWNWIFKDYKKHGYATLFSEDDPKIAAFNYRFPGFRNEPTDHYARPFWIALDKVQKDNCVGGMAIHNISFNYVQDFCDTYPKRPKFALAVLSYLTHANMNTLSYADDDLVRLLRNLDAKHHINESIVIIFGDHGYRFSYLRKSLQGKMEERLPFLSIIVPKWFPWRYPEAYSNLKHNAELLTSPFDVYATLRHVLSYPASPSNIKTGQSLFDRIDEKARTCSQAGIASHWCPCMQWEKIDSDQKISQKIANAFVEYINYLTSAVNLCQPFQSRSVLSIFKEMPNSQVQRFKKTMKTAKCDSCVPVYDETKVDLSTDGLYQLQLALYPGYGLFEFTVRVVDGYPVLDSRFISRINAYGDQPHCIKTTHTHLVKYCYCRKQL